jgi:hypothetical protein
MLDDPDLRRRTENKIGRWYIRIGVLSTVFTLLVLLFERNSTLAYLDWGVVMVGMIAPQSILFRAK